MTEAWRVFHLGRRVWYVGYQDHRPIFTVDGRHAAWFYDKASANARCSALSGCTVVQSMKADSGRINA